MHVLHGNMVARVGHNRIIGHEMFGFINAVGAGVTGPTKEQKVVVRPLDPDLNCPASKAGNSRISQDMKFLGLDTDGAIQEVWTVPANTIQVLPDDMRMDHAALIEPVAVACHDLRLSGLELGEDVVVIGGGPIGIVCAMVARDAGGKVVVSEVNQARPAIARALEYDTPT